MTLKTRITLITLIAILCIACDILTKNVAQTHLSSVPPIRLLGGVLRLQYTENTGVILGLGAQWSPATRFWTFGVFIGIVILSMLIFTLSSPHMTPLGIVAAALIIGGGLGNLIDRMFNQGAVIDFMNLGIGDLRTGIFNFADVAIMAGAGLMILWSILTPETNPPRPQDTEESEG